MIPSSLADAAASADTAADGRPEFLVRLGLLLPCSVDDVEAVFRERAKQVHPDHGGTAAEFSQLQADYEAAREYAGFHANRRAWLGANIERYAAQQEVIAEIARRGGSVETHRPKWIAREIGGDFAQVLDTITAVRITGPDIGLEDVQFLASRSESLASLQRLDLSNSYVDCRAVKLLTVFSTLHELDLSGTLAGNRTASVLAGMPALRRVNLADTFVTWRGRFVLRRRRPDLAITTRRDGELPVSRARRAYRWLLRALIVYVFAMLLATHYPGEPEFVRAPRFPGADKAAHFGIYFGLTSLLAFVLSLRSTNRRSRTGLSVSYYAGIAVFVAVFAALDEVTQPWTGRERDFKDWLADVAGMAAGLVIFTLIQLYRRRRLELAFSPPPPVGRTDF